MAMIVIVPADLALTRWPKGCKSFAPPPENVWIMEISPSNACKCLFGSDTEVWKFIPIFMNQRTPAKGCFINSGTSAIC